MLDVSSDRFQIRKLRNQSEKLSRAIIVWNVPSRTMRSTFKSILEGSCVNYSDLKITEQPFDRNKRDTQGRSKLRP